MIEANNSCSRPMGLLSKLVTLARVSLLPQDSPARALYQAHLSQDSKHSGRDGHLKDCVVASSFALSLFIFLAIFASAAGDPARLFGWTADIGCAGLISPADPSECSRSYGAVAMDSMSPAEWEAVLKDIPDSLAWKFRFEMLHGQRFLAVPANEAQLLAMAQNKVRSRAEATQEELAALGSTLLGAVVAQEGLAKPMERARELAAQAALRRSTPPEAPTLATVSSPGERARLRQLGEQSKTQSRKDAREAAIGELTRKEDSGTASWAATACLLLGSIAIGALTRFSLAVGLTTSREHRALHVAFEYFELSKPSSRLGTAKGSSGRGQRRL